MKSLFSIAGAVFFAIIAIASAQAPNPTVDSYIATAKTAAGTEWSGTFLRLCIPPSAGPQAAGGQRLAVARVAAEQLPARLPRKLGMPNRPKSRITSISSAPRSIAHGQSSAAKASSSSRRCSTTPRRDEILDGLKKVGLDPKNVKYVILSHAHGDHDGGAVLLQDSIPGVHLIYGAEDWDAVDKAHHRQGQA